MKTVKDYIAKTRLRELTEQEFARECAQSPPLFIHLNGSSKSLAEADTAKIGTIVIDPAKHSYGNSSPEDNPVYEVKKDLNRNSFGMFITVGRAQNNDLILPSDKVSKLHAMIKKVDDGYSFADWNSTNGSRMVLHGDNIECPPKQDMTLEDRCTLIVGSKMGDILLYLANPASIYDYMTNIHKY
jgi:hypothetical protein